MNIDRRLKVAPQGLIITISLGGLSSVLLVAQAYVLSQIVYQVFLEHQTDVGDLILLLVVIGILRAIVLWGGEVTATRMAEWVKVDLRRRLYSHILSLGPAYTTGERSGELVNTITQGIEDLDAYLREYLPALILAALSPFIFLLFIFPQDVFSGFVLLVTAPLLPFFMFLIGNTAGALQQRQWKTLSHMSAHFLDVLQGLTTLKLFGRSRAQIEIIRQVSDQFRQTTLGVLRVAFISALVLEMVATISTAIIAVEIGLRLLYGQFHFQTALFILILAPEFYLPLRHLGSRFHAGTTGITAARRIFTILETALPVADSAAADVPGFQQVIRFDSVCYSSEDRLILDDLTFTLGVGERVALVGVSGAGKTTLSQMLLRFIHPQSGTITVDGKSLAHLPAANWRHQIAWVPQRPYLFNTTIAENIRLGRPDAAESDLIHAARQAYAHDFIMQFPQGYETVIGEQGIRLSGGQIQRIALARAFLKDAPLLILDEATANLDSESEQFIQEAITRMLQGRTALIIAHRLHTIYQCDRILVLDAGRVIASGEHAQLLQQSEVYRQLVMTYEGGQP